MRIKIPILLFCIVLTLLFGACAMLTPQQQAGRDVVRGRVVKIETTAYCSCGSCCSWQRNWKGQAVYASGKLKGKPKVVGQTASGTMAKPGTIAADTRYYPFGTILYIPGYGYGRVEDTGGDIKGRARMDLYFNTHEQAKKWGRRTLKVVVFPEGTPLIPKNAKPPQ